jgi:DNA-binding MarR family transcriptional regulator
MLDKMSDASRIVERLHKKGLLSRMANEKDRRAVDILISKQGLAILQELDVAMDMDEVLKENLTVDEAAKLCNLLDKFRG